MLLKYLAAGLVRRASVEDGRHVIGRRLAGMNHSRTALDDDESSPLQSKRSSMLSLFPISLFSVSFFAFGYGFLTQTCVSAFCFIYFLYL